MPRRGTTCTNGIMLSYTQTSACFPLLLSMRLWRISIRRYRRALLQGSTHIGLESQFYENPQHKIHNLPLDPFVSKFSMPVGIYAYMPRNASHTLTSRAVVFTSWTRKMEQPFSMPHRFTAAVPSSLSAAGRSRMVPMKRFRLTPKSQG